MKSKPIVDFESYLKSVKSYKWFHSKKNIYIYQIDNQQVFRLSQTKIK